MLGRGGSCAPGGQMLRRGRAAALGRHIASERSARRALTAAMSQKSAEQVPSARQQLATYGELRSNPRRVLAIVVNGRNISQDGRRRQRGPRRTFAMRTTMLQRHHRANYSAGCSSTTAPPRHCSNSCNTFILQLLQRRLQHHCSTAQRRHGIAASCNT
jgi:hypothetical protein